MAPDRTQPGTNTVQQLSFLSPESSTTQIVLPDDTPPVTQHTALSIARMWFRHHLLELDRPANTVESYTYDLVVMEHRITDKPLNRITETDIAMYLAEASNKVTRKRRLTSAKAFFRYLTADLRVLNIDPSEGFSPHPLEHRFPDILTEIEQESLIAAALADEPWSAPAIWLMLHLGLGRTELLALRRDHIDRTTVAGPEVLVAYNTPGRLNKQRTLLANDTFAGMYELYLEEKQPQDILFPYGPQAVNGMVDRVAAAAGIGRKITPQLLRHTAAVAMAARGYDINELLAKLGLANDARNRETVRMYMTAATEIGRDDAPEVDKEP